VFAERADGASVTRTQSFRLDSGGVAKKFRRGVYADCGIRIADCGL